MRHMAHLRNASEAVGHQERAAAYGDQWQFASVGLHPIDRVLDFCPHNVQRPLHKIAREIGDRSFVADLSKAGRDRDIGRSHGIAAEDQSLFDQPVTDASRPDGNAVGRDEAPAAKPDRQ